MRRVVSLSVLIVACAGAPAPTPRTAPPPTVPAAPPDLRATCGDLARFRAATLGNAPTEARPALSRWHPPTPVAAGNRPVVVEAVRRYLALCGLDEAVDLTRALVAFPTVSARQSPADGPDFASLARFLAQWSQEAGLSFEVVGANDAWEIGLGTGAPAVGLVMHADVVPVDDSAPGTTAPTPTTGTLPPGWSRPPFDAEVVGDRLYGRGTEDDKGPIAASLVILRTLARAGLAPTSGRLLVILGTAEENDWDGMERYVASRPRPRHVISVDANFPVVVAESGFVAFHLEVENPFGARDRAAPARRSERATIVSAQAGLFLTQIPGEARMVLAPGAHETVELLLARAQAAALEESGRARSFRVEVAPEGEHVVVRTFGKAVHSSVAEEGDNALWPLSSMAVRLNLERGRRMAALRLIHQSFDGDHWGERLGLAYAHPLMGRLLVAPTMLRDHDDVTEIGINMRRPAGCTKEEFEERLRAAIPRMARDANWAWMRPGQQYVGDPAMADTDGPLVPTLLDIYRRTRAEPSAVPISIRGGTYARLFPGAVSFGPSLPGREYRGHAPDEYIELEALGAVVTMLYEAVVRLQGPLTQTASP